MASYEKRNNKWTVRFRVDGQNKRLSGYDTKKDAEQAYIKAKATSKKSTDNLTILQLFELYKNYKQPRIKESSFCSIIQSLQDYVLPYFEKMKISNLKATDIANWQNEINSKSIKYATKNRIHRTFVNFVNFAVDFYNLPFNPVSKVGNFKNNELKPQMDFWTEQEFTQFISVVDDLTHKAFFSTLYLTGARKGEIMALTWQDINFDTSIINITKTYTNKVVGGGYKITPPKTKSSNRQILMTASLTNLLKNLHTEQQTYVGYTPKCFVFGFSRPLALISIDRNKTKYCNLAGVKQIRIHDFRHSHASLLLNKGQNILLVAQRLGHSDINQTLNTYSHLFPNRQKEIIDSIDIIVDN